MKNMPLSFQIWLMCVGITGLIFMLLVLFLPWTLNEFFTKQVFKMLGDSQPTVGVIKLDSFSDTNLPQSSVKITVKPNIKISTKNESDIMKGIYIAQASGGVVTSVRPDRATIFQEQYTVTTSLALGKSTLDNINISVLPVTSGDSKLVRHMVFSGDNKTLCPDDLPIDSFNLIKNEALIQKEIFKEYYHKTGGKTLYYVIRRSIIENQPVYAVTYSWGTYWNGLVKTMYWRLLVLMFILLVLSWFPSMGLAKYLSRPLIQMETEAARIAEHDWHQPIQMVRRDEIGRLARAFEQMRQKLISQDEAQRSFLQNVSHELKTPVMVVHSYAQSILDGVYPRGTQEASIDVIIKESERLESRIKDLLYLNKLNYLSSHQLDTASFDLSQIISDCAERFQPRRPELEWDYKLPPLLVTGNKQQWEVGLENLLDNQLRHACNKIRITANRIDEMVILRVWNDGNSIDPQLLPNLFEPFSSGKDGEIGLGLAILKRVADLNKSSVWAENEQQGVSFCIQIPSNTTQDT
ncbi:MAG: sensor histidine kinase [Chitinophagales bacterium]